MRDELLTSLPLVDAILANHTDVVGADLAGYRHHVYRVVNIAAWHASPAAHELDVLQVAGAFHDLGIWTARTFDYLAPSMALARDYLTRTGRSAAVDGVEAMIAQHHKVTRVAAPEGSMVEAFRQADWVDVTAGVVRFDLPLDVLDRIRRRWPDEGFHWRLMQLSAARLVTHPRSPLPMLRW